jgi:two-component system OmpR family response regulator
MRILLAEDDRNISTIAKMALEHLGGHTVINVDNGILALETLITDDHLYDVILLDEMMPGLSGLKVCEKYLAQKAQPKPVIFLSAKSQASDIQEFLSLGWGYIPKPFNPTQLGSQIQGILGQRHKGSKAA